MLFNSLDFAFFLPVVFFLYWFVFGKQRKWQNILLLVASYVFYGWWDWRFLGLILFSTIVDFFIGVGLGKEDRKLQRKLLLLISILVNVGFLGYFKYANFFLDNLVGVFSLFGQDIGVRSLDIILPVGISFYTFQTLSYSIDVYRRKLEPTKDFLVYSAYVSFFPQLVAGPIERATRLLPQFTKDRNFAYSKVVDGLRQILWGLFKKVVIADSAAFHADIIFNDPSSYTGSTVLYGALLFAIQIYGDFSGYSDIAIGVARLFGFDLMNNFAFPYFSRDIGEFWRRWHISLTSWFRDYVYIPLGGSRGGIWRTIRNTFIIFLISGFWHGANWTFVLWGLINAIYFLPLMITGRNRKNLGEIAPNRVLPSFREILEVGSTFALTVFAWIFFRAEDFSHLSIIMNRIFSKSLFTKLWFEYWEDSYNIVILIFVMLIVEWFGRQGKFALETFGKKWPAWLRWLFYYFLIALIILFSGNEQQFIYFQF